MLLNFSYNVAKNADQAAFEYVCRKIESAQITGLEKKNTIVDVDGSQIQLYVLPESEIRVFNDYEVDAVYIDSGVDLSFLFPLNPGKEETK